MEVIAGAALFQVKLRDEMKKNLVVTLLIILALIVGQARATGGHS